ncbi:class I SAM-dependent methyltransferase [Streptomyces sp. NPDC006627]|uniref:class I SAM-dependent methyltransferase n=1 Tax=Streptomyces sp. NPDC006627 TaxID=3154679 RepID=UPI0033B942C6
MPETSVAHFYDELADDYHLIYSDWDASIRRQGGSLDALIGQERAAVLDCSCGIGTQAIGLALRGHRVTGTDLSRRAAARAAREAASRNLSLRTAAADMRRLPFPDGRFDTVVCADNSLPHLLTEHDVHAALAEIAACCVPTACCWSAHATTMTCCTTARLRRLHSPQERRLHRRRRTNRQLPALALARRRRALRPGALPTPSGRRRMARPVRRTTYWALGGDRLAGLAAEAGFADPEWRMPHETGFFQPLLVARAGG